MLSSTHFSRKENSASNPPKHLERLATRSRELWGKKTSANCVAHKQEDDEGKALRIQMLMISGHVVPTNYKTSIMRPLRPKSGYYGY